MRSPFPGMDPFIEAFGLWEDFHDDLISEIKRALAATLPDRYVVRIGERSYIDYIDPAGRERSSSFKADVSAHSLTAQSAPAQQPTASTAVIEDEPGTVIMHGLVGDEHRETFLEILELDPTNRLVTSLEILSPTNKHFGTGGWHLYQRKRKVFLDGHANFVEIDLLRGGHRMFMKEPWPNSPYYLLVIRKELAPECAVVPAYFDRPLQPIPIPLASPDPDATLHLQPLLDAVYQRSRYHLQIDYQQPLKPPLDPETSTLLEERFRQMQPGPNGPN